MNFWMVKGYLDIMEHHIHINYYIKNMNYYQKNTLKNQYYKLNTKLKNRIKFKLVFKIKILIMKF